MWEQLLEDAPRFFGIWNLKFLGQALLNTLLLSYLGAAFGFAIGFSLAIGRHPRLYGMAPIRLLATAYVEVFRRIPFLVKLMCVFFAFQLSGAQASLFTIALVTVVLSAAAGLRLGWALLDTRGWSRLESLQRTAPEALATAGLATVLFILAAFIEGFVSPSTLPYATKAGVAVATAAALVFYFLLPLVLFGTGKGKHGHDA